MLRAEIGTLGNSDLLKTQPVGLFCSARCPGTLIVQAYDLARALRDSGIPVIGGFHSPIEKECLDLLLRGSQPIIVCLARSLSGMRVPQAWRPAISEGRLLLMSDFAEGMRRVTAEAASRRNELVAELARALLIIHAAPASATLSLCERANSTGKPVFALDSPHNTAVERLGASMISPTELGSLVRALK